MTTNSIVANALSVARNDAYSNYQNLKLFKGDARRQLDAVRHSSDAAVAYITAMADKYKTDKTDENDSIETCKKACLKALADARQVLTDKLKNVMQ